MKRACSSQSSDILGKTFPERCQPAATRKERTMTSKEAYEILNKVVDFTRSAIFYKLAENHESEGSDAVDRLADAADDFMYENFGDVEGALETVKNHDKQH